MRERKDFMRSVILTLLITASGAGPVGCGGGGGPTNGNDRPPPPPSVVTSPMQLNVYPVDQSAQGPARIFVFVSAVGSQSVRLPVAFDTGSAGLTLSAQAIFPASMVTSSGFVFEAGQTSLSYNGITVTSQQASRAYGGPNGRTQLGNIGYAEVTFGDSAGSLTTQLMPVLFYYSIVSTATQQPVTPEAQRGWFGVNDAPNLVNVSASPAPFPACGIDTSGSCWAVSVFKYLGYATGVDGGFVLNPIHVQNCDITASGSCQAQSALTIGVSQGLAAGFSLTPLPCPPQGYTGPSVINGFSVCQERVPGTTIASATPPSGSYVAGALFDTGTPDFELNVLAGTVFPAAIPAGDTFQVTTPSGFTYTTTAGAGIYTVNVNSVSTATASVVGLGYFTTNALFVDFATGMQGWK